jgi:cytochrome c
LETRRWKAFLRMNGETTVDSSQDILSEFKAMVEYLKWIGVDYSIVVQVEATQAESGRTLALEQTPHRREAEQPGA